MKQTIDQKYFRRNLWPLSNRNKIKVKSTGRVRFENGKAVKNWEDFDSLGFMQPLGMELKPKEAEKK